MNFPSIRKIFFFVFVCALTANVAFAQQDTVKVARKLTGAIKDSLKRVYDLQGVTVVGNKPLITTELDRIIYNAAADPNAKTLTVLEILKKVPMITVDADDKISLNGSSNFVIHRNGKPSGMFKQNPEEVLENMPANAVRNIEVIIDPGAKYDAEGVAGIINIVTVPQNSMTGYTTTVRADANSQGKGQTGIHLMAKQGRVGFTGTLSGTRNSRPDSYTDKLSENFLDNSIISEQAKTNSKGYGLLGSGEFSFEIDTLNLINIGYSARHNEQDTFWDGITSQSIANDFIYSVDRNTRGNSNRNGTDVNIDYQRTSAKNAKRMLTLSYRFSHSPRHSESESYYSNPNPIDDFPVNIALYARKQYTDASTNEHTFQLDYSTPFGKKHMVETGIKYIFRSNKSSSDYLRFSDLEGWVSRYPSNSSRNDITLFEHRNNILSAYGSYALKLGKWGLRTGVRYEYTFLDVEFERNVARNFDKMYSNFVPSVLGTYKIDNAQTIRLGYNMRLTRPGIGQLNPYINDSNPNFIQTGNPDLNAVLTHSLNANYAYNTQKFNFNANLRFIFMNNGIEQITRIENGTSISTYENIRKVRATPLTVYFNWSPAKRFKLSSNLGGNFIDMRSNNGSLPAFNYFYGWSFSELEYRLPWKIWLIGDVGTFLPYKTLQTTVSAYWYHQLALRKSFAKDRLNVRIYAQNPFIENDKRKTTVENPTFYQEQNLTTQRRYFGFAISYRFGALKTKLKKTSKSIDNDDVVENEQSEEKESEN